MIRSAVLPFLFMVLLLVPLAGAGQGSDEADDWPTLHGDAGRTGSRGSVEGPGTGEIVWRFLTESINVVSSPAVAYGRVYIGASDGNVYALDAWTGEKVWAYKTEGKVRASPVVSNGTVFVGSSDGYLYALDAVDGVQRWRFEVGGDVRSTATVHGGTVFVGSPGGVVYALDVLNGSLVWSGGPGKGLSSAGHAVGNSLLYNDGLLLFGAADNHVHALSAETGDVKWKVRVYANADSIATDGKRLFMMGGFGTLYALDSEGGDIVWTRHVGSAGRGAPSVTGETVYIAGHEALYALVAQTGALEWSAADSFGYSVHVAVSESHVFTIGNGGSVTARELQNGEVAWQRQIATYILSSPVVVDGMLYVGSNQFRVFALDAGAGVEQMPSATGGPPQNREMPSLGFAILAAAAVYGVVVVSFHQRRR